MSIYKHIKDNEDIISKDSLIHIIHHYDEILDDYLDKEEKHHLERKVWCILSDGHYNKEYAEEDVAKMYYMWNGEKVHAPYYSLEDTTPIYNQLKKSYSILVNYNIYDFYVVMNMIKSDNYVLYKKRFPNYSEERLIELFIEDAINWLDDMDNPYGTSKVWKYLNK